MSRFDILATGVGLLGLPLGWWLGGILLTPLYKQNTPVKPPASPAQLTEERVRKIAREEFEKAWKAKWGGVLLTPLPKVKGGKP